MMRPTKIREDLWTKYRINEYDQLLSTIIALDFINSQVYPGVERMITVILTNMPSKYIRRVRESLC